MKVFNEKDNTRAENFSREYVFVCVRLRDCVCVCVVLWNQRVRVVYGWLLGCIVKRKKKRFEWASTGIDRVLLVTAHWRRRKSCVVRRCYPRRRVVVMAIDLFSFDISATSGDWLVGFFTVALCFWGLLTKYFFFSTKTKMLFSRRVCVCYFWNICTFSFVGWFCSFVS